MSRCETTPVVSDNEQGFYLINAEDFDPEKHTRYEAPKPIDLGASPPAAPDAPAAAAVPPVPAWKKKK